MRWWPEELTERKSPVTRRPCLLAKTPRAGAGSRSSALARRVGSEEKPTGGGAGHPRAGLWTPAGRLGPVLSASSRRIDRRTTGPARVVARRRSGDHGQSETIANGACTARALARR